MLTLPCPFCGQRDETEFINGGPTKPARPSPTVSDADWIEWLTVPQLRWLCRREMVAR